MTLIYFWAILLITAFVTHLVSDVFVTNEKAQMKLDKIAFNSLTVLFMTGTMLLIFL